MQVQHFEYEWPIGKDDISKMKFDESIESPIFATVRNGIRCHWELKLFPKGRKTEENSSESDRLAIGLKLAEGGLAEVPEVEIFVNAGRRDPSAAAKVKDPCSEFYFLEMPKYDMGTMAIRLTIKENVFGPIAFTNPEYVLRPHWKLIPLYKRTVFGEKTEEGDEDEGDFTLIAEGGEKLRCHKYFLKESSPVFKAMLKPHTEESRSGETVITDTSLATLQKLLYYFYIDDLPEDWDKEGVLELLLAAHKYEVAGMEFFCEKSLVEQLSLQNVVELLIIGQRLERKILPIRAKQFIIDHWAKLPREEKKRLQHNEDAYLAVMDAACMEKALCKG